MKGAATRAAEGFDHRSFSVDEILRMQETGIIGEDENFELVEGEIVPMHAKTHRPLQHLEMLRHRGAADEKAGGEFANRAGCLCQPLEDRLAGGAAQGGQSRRRCCVCHGSTVSNHLR